MTMLASQITSLTVVYSIVYSGVIQRKHQSSASLAFVREIHRGPVNFPHKWPVTRKMFPFDDVIMLTSNIRYQWQTDTFLAWSPRRWLQLVCWFGFGFFVLIIATRLTLVAEIFISISFRGLLREWFQGSVVQTLEVFFVVDQNTKVDLLVIWNATTAIIVNTSMVNMGSVHLIEPAYKANN